MIAIGLRVHVMLAMVCLATSTLRAQENWQREHNSGAKAAKAANFAEAEKLLSQSADEARKAGNANLLARSLLDLAEVYRSEGKYTPSQTAYNEALQLYTKQDGAESPAVAEVRRTYRLLLAVIGCRSKRVYDHTGITVGLTFRLGEK